MSDEILGSVSFQGNLNDTLNPECIDVSEDDVGLRSNLVRTIIRVVSKCFTPRKIIIILRLLKALTFCLLCLTLAADLMYIFFVKMEINQEIFDKFGGTRDLVIRIYGVGIVIMALMMELDMPFMNTNFAGLKGFFPRSLLLLFISMITTPPSIFWDGNDDEYSGDDRSNEIPDSSVVFQAATSGLLGACALLYFILGMLCFDRFTTRAFLSDRDPVTSTVIPQTTPSVAPSVVSNITTNEPESRWRE